MTLEIQLRACKRRHKRRGFVLGAVLTTIRTPLIPGLPALWAAGTSQWSEQQPALGSLAGDSCKQLEASSAVAGDGKKNSTLQFRFRKTVNEL